MYFASKVARATYLNLNSYRHQGMHSIQKVHCYKHDLLKWKYESQIHVFMHGES